MQLGHMVWWTPHLNLHDELARTRRAGLRYLLRSSHNYTANPQKRANAGQQTMR